MAKTETPVVTVLRRNSPPADETREQRFVRVAERRVSAAIKDIWLLARLASPNYKSSPMQIAAMKAAIFDAADHAFQQLENIKPNRQITFKFTED